MNTDEPRESRLDPLALSSETTARFRMLCFIAFVLALSLPSLWIPVDLLEDSAEYGVTPPTVDEEELVVRPEGFDLDLLASKLASDTRLRRTLTSQTLQVLMTLLLIPVLWLLAYVAFHRAQRSIIEDKGLQPLTTERAPKVVAELESWCASLRVRPRPVWHWKPGFLDGLTLGTSEVPILAMAGRPEDLEKSWSDLHRAVALHELGHVVTRDTENRESVRSIWAGLGLLVTGTALVLAVRGASASQWLDLTIRLGGAAVAGALIWAGLVRSREFFADACVVQWGWTGALKKRLSLPQALIRRVPGESIDWLLRPWQRLPDRIRRFLAFHPSNYERLQALDQPERLFRVSRSVALVTGWLLSTAVGYLGLPALLLVVLVGVPLQAGLIFLAGGLPAIAVVVTLIAVGTLTLLPVTYWVVGALGVQILRASAGDLADPKACGWGYSALAQIAGLFVAGVELGAWLTPIGWRAWQSPGWMLLWILVFWLMIWFWLIQARALGRLCLGSRAGRDRPKRLEGALRFFLTALLLPLFWPAVLGRVTLAARVTLSRMGAETWLGQTPEALETFLGVTALGAMTLALFANAVLGVLGLSVIGLRLRFRKASCPSCRERWMSWRTIGLNCLGCDQAKASWLYQRESSRAVPVPEVPA